MNELPEENENGTPPPVKKNKKGKKVVIAGDEEEEEVVMNKKKKKVKTKAPSTSQNEVRVDMGAEINRGLLSHGLAWISRKV